MNCHCKYCPECASCDKPPAPDLLNQLHTLRSLANDVKQQADSMRVWEISVIVATISEEATICIQKMEATDGANDQSNNVVVQGDAKSGGAPSLS